MTTGLVWVKYRAVLSWCHVCYMYGNVRVRLALNVRPAGTDSLPDTRLHCSCLRIDKPNDITL